MNGYGLIILWVGLLIGVMLYAHRLAIEDLTFRIERMESVIKLHAKP